MLFRSARTLHRTWGRPAGGAPSLLNFDNFGGARTLHRTWGRPAGGAPSLLNFDYFGAARTLRRTPGADPREAHPALSTSKTKRPSNALPPLHPATYSNPQILL